MSTRIVVAVFIFVLVMAFAWGIGGCASSPAEPVAVAIVVHHPAEGVLLTLCGEQVAILITTDDGSIWINRKVRVSEKVWDAGLLEIQALGAHGSTIDLLPNCTKASL